jgi:hypothetical protein
MVSHHCHQIPRHVDIDVVCSAVRSKKVFAGRRGHLSALESYRSGSFRPTSFVSMFSVFRFRASF